MRYHKAIERSGSTQSWKLKAVFVGAVRAGKTSLARSLMASGARPSATDDRTRGVDVHIERPWKPDTKSALELVFWDFAGHSNYYSTHQLFLTKGALYLLVVDLNLFSKDSTSRYDTVYMWLDALLCRVPGSGVVVVATHIDLIAGQEEDARQDLQREVIKDLDLKKEEHDRQKLKQKSQEMGPLPSLEIIDVVSVSSLTGENLSSLSGRVAKLVQDQTGTSHMWAS